MKPQIETVPVINGSSRCPDCGIELRIAKSKDGSYRRTRACSHLVAVHNRNGKFEATYVVESEDS
jgi:hypothetical protein